MFHYFGSKKKLFLSVLDQGMETYTKYLENELKELPRDLLDRYMTICSVKVKMFMEHPDIYILVSDAFRDPPTELREELNERQERMIERYMEYFHKNVDVSLFRNEFELNKLQQLVFSVLDTLTLRYMDSFKRLPDRGISKLPEVMKEFEEYITILKVGVYK